MNKILGAVLFALLVLFGTKTATNHLFVAHHPEKPGFEVAIPESVEGAGEAAGEAEKAVPLPNLLAEASAEKGASVAKKCAACHTFEQGGANKIGPNLHNVVGRELGTVDGFAYSGALKNKGGTWTYEALSDFIANPKGFIPGTKMAFPGVKRGDQRADVIMYLREQTENAPPLPEPVAQAQPEQAPAEGQQKPPAEGQQQPAQEQKPPAESQQQPAQQQKQPPAESQQQQAPAQPGSPPQGG